MYLKSEILELKYNKVRKIYKVFSPHFHKQKQ